VLKSLGQFSHVVIAAPLKTTQSGKPYSDGALPEARASCLTRHRQSAGLAKGDMSRGPCRSQPDCIAALVYITAVQPDLTLPSVAHQCLVLRPNSDQHVLLTIDTLVPLGRAPQPLPDRIVPRVHSAGSSGECRSDLSNLESSTLKCLSLFAERQRSNLQSPRAECHLYIQMGEFEQRDVVHQVRPVCPGGVDHAWNLV
jgi:hypothetical protein